MQSKQQLKPLQGSGFLQLTVWDLLTDLRHLLDVSTFGQTGAVVVKMGGVVLARRLGARERAPAREATGCHLNMGELGVDMGAGGVHIQGAVAARIHTRRLIILIVYCILLHRAAA